MSEESKFVVFGDWRDTRAAIEKAVPEYASFPEDERVRMWSLVTAFAEHYAPMRAKCLGCGVVVPARQVYRCADCHAHLCENCIKPHFGPNHRPHASADGVP